ADYCGSLSIIVDIAIILSVALPALGGFFSTLADLYQWDRQISIYKSAGASIDVADAHSPYPEMDDIFYRSSLNSYDIGTLQGMSDETAQWGQSIRTPKSLDDFVAEAREKAATVGGDANANSEAVPDVPLVQSEIPPVRPASPPADAPIPPNDEPPTDEGN